MKKEIFIFKDLKDFVLSLTPPSPIHYVVSKEQQEIEIFSLKQTLGSRRFFFVTNLENYEIESAQGIERWLGYSEHDFTMKKYLDYVVHPGRRKSMIMVATQIFDACCRGKYSLNFMVQRYNSLVALKHYNGNYLLANKISSVFQYDKNNCLTAYLNEFTIIGDYHDQPMEPAFFLSTGENEQRGKEILQKTIEQFLQLGVFTDREFQLARKLAYEPYATKQQIAHELDLSVHTVDEYGKRFLTKARAFFQKQFLSVAEAAIYLKKEGLM